MDTNASDPNAGPGLRRSLSLPWLVLYGLGTTIGAGIYALAGVVAGRVGLHAPVAFLVASLLALFTALSFGELASRFPRAGGEAVYVREGFRSRYLAVLVGVLVVLAGLISAATVCVAFVGYLGELLALPRTPVIVCVVASVGAVAAWGVKQSVTVAGLMTLVEVGGLLAIVAIGGSHLGAVPERLPELLPHDQAAWHALGGATFLCFYAFLGFEDMVNVAEEVQDVRRVLPRAILLTLGLTALLYALVTAVAVLAVPAAELAASDAPLSLVFERLGGSAALLGWVAILALLNGALIQVMKAARVLYGMARDGALPAWLGRVHPRTRTPVVATGIATTVVAGLALRFPLEALAETTAVVTLGTFGLTNLALILVKRRGAGPPGSVSFPLWVPACGAVSSLGFLAFEAWRRAAGG